MPKTGNTPDQTTPTTGPPVLVTGCRYPTLLAILPYMALPATGAAARRRPPPNCHHDCSNCVLVPTELSSNP